MTLALLVILIQLVELDVRSSVLMVQGHLVHEREKEREIERDGENERGR